MKSKVALVVMTAVLLSGAAYGGWDRVVSLNRAPEGLFEQPDVYEVECADGSSEFRSVSHLKEGNVCHADRTGTRPGSLYLLADERIQGPLETNGDSEAKNLENHLKSASRFQGFDTRLIRRVNDPAFLNSLKSAAAVVLPEPEEGRYSDYLGDDVRKLREYVRAGGVAVLFTNNLHERQQDISDISLNRLFDLGQLERPAGTPFERLHPSGPVSRRLPAMPAQLTEDFHVRTLNRSRIPGDAEVLYDDEDSYNDALVVIFPYGKGHVAWFGFDYSGIPPYGSRDGGWVAVFDAVVGNLAGRAEIEWEPPLEPPQPDGGGSGGDGDRHYDDEF